MLELQQRDIEVRLSVAELDADLEALHANRGEFADEGLAGDAGLVAVAWPSPRVSQPFASGRPSRASRASLSSSSRLDRAHRAARTGPRAGQRAPGCARRTARRGLPATRAAARARRVPPGARHGLGLPAAHIKYKWALT
jgi:hypothetical protein